MDTHDLKQVLGAKLNWITPRIDLATILIPVKGEVKFKDHPPCLTPPNNAKITPQLLIAWDDRPNK